MKKGDRVKLSKNASDDADRWGNNHSHKLLSPKKIYTVLETEVHSWHTKVRLNEIEGVFNSVIFDIVE